MKSSKLTEIFKNGNIVVPIYLLKNYKNMNLELDEFIFLMYLYHFGDNFIFNPSSFGEELNIPLNDVMVLVGSLTSKGFIDVTAVENDKGYMEDIISLAGFYNKIKSFFVEEVVSDDNELVDSSLFEFIEKEFARTISSFEYEIISAWLQSGYEEELIKEAVKEAINNGVANFKYIDKILYEWNKKGIKSVQDVESNRKKRNNEMKKNKESNSNIDLDIVDWNWFDDE